MNRRNPRPHHVLAADSCFELGRVRGAALRDLLRATSDNYEALFRLVNVDEADVSQGVEAVLSTLHSWRPSIVEELEGVAVGSGMPIERIVAINSRTEILALGTFPSSECSTITASIGGRNWGVQTWDWLVLFDELWHTHEVTGTGHRFVGLAEPGMLSKIGMNDAGLGLHFNMLGHRDDHPEGVPMHVISAVVLAECASVSEAVDLISEAPVTSSSAFTLIDSEESVSIEVSPRGVFPVAARGGSVQRTNNFQHAGLAEGQKSELFEPDSSGRLHLIRERLGLREPADERELVEMLVSVEGEPLLTCVPDPARAVEERTATLATVLSNPDTRELRVFVGMPPEALQASPEEWRTLVA